MKVYHIFILAILITVLTTALTYLFLQHINSPGDLIDVKAIPMKVEISDIVGFNLNNSEMNFGSIPPGGRARRNITVTNGYEKDVQVYVKTDGDMGYWVKGYANSFRLNRGESNEIMLVCTPPGSAPYGNYSGSIRFSFYKVS